MMKRSWLAIVALAVACGVGLNLSLGQQAKPVGAAQQANAAVPSWIWGSEKSGPRQTFEFRKVFTPAGAVRKATLIASADNHCTVKLNGKKVLENHEWSTPGRAEVTLKEGKNVLSIQAANDNDTSAAALIAWVDITYADGKKEKLVTDGTWEVAAKGGQAWEAGDAVEGTIKPVVVAKLGGAPWGNILGAARQGGAARDPGKGPELKTIEGFKTELLYTVPSGTQGSWVSLTTDPKGRLIASDQNGPLYRITPPPLGGKAEDTKVEQIPVNIGSAQGLLCAFDSLYVVINGGGKYGGSGLYRVRDTDGDDQYDKVEKLKSFDGGGEHGPHAVITTPDGKGLLIAAGNHTKPPAGLTGYRVPKVWGEDHLLPRQPDGNGHANGVMAPGGWIVRTDPDGKEWEIVSSGFRNQYDIALNGEGELFTYDADMEWDFGMPWYRPTRVNHAVSGSEFGWRHGTGKWPDYYIDSLGAVVDIGPGCPTGVAFGAGAKFPAKYQKALYILDWTFGTIYAIHMKPSGASYVGEAEEFVTAEPLPVTDITIGLDGAMYFTVGGRNTQSRLYRVTYTGGESTAPVAQGETAGAELRAQRRKLESFHGRQDPAAIAAAWPMLSHEDRNIRFAARIAIEHQDVASWQEKALSETNPVALMHAMTALARHGDKSLAARATQALAKVDYKSLSASQRLDYLRAMQLVFIRLGKPSAELGAQVAKSLDAFYPAATNFENRELCNLLVALESPTVITKTLELMKQAKDDQQADFAGLTSRNPGYGKAVMDVQKNGPNRQQTHYAFALRNLRYGWTLEQREYYFGWFLEAGKRRGGNSYPNFLKNIRKDALTNSSEGERAAVAKLTGEDIRPRPKFTELPRAKGPARNWSSAELEKLVAQTPKGRDFENGRKMFAAALCLSCHRFDGDGGAAGPDLTSLASRFTRKDLIESIMEPSKVISDQYQSMILSGQDGQPLAVGRVLKEEDDKIHLLASPLAPDQVTIIEKSKVKQMKPSPVSLMPPALLTALNEDEVLDLIAYIMSRGNAKDAMFGK